LAIVGRFSGGCFAIIVTSVFLKDALPPLSLWSSLVDALPMLLLEARLDFFEWMLRHQGLLLFNKNVTVEIKKDSSHKDESKYYLRPRKKNAIHSVTF
jgi:uracil DNA glycosylase